MAKKWTAETGLPDLAGKVAIVTGGNSGLGYYTVSGLALRGAKVYLGARNKKRALDAIDKLYADHTTVKNGQVIWLQLDLADLRSIITAAETIISDEARLDILVNNAGILHRHFETNENGFEMTMVVNHLGHFLLTKRLLPLLKKTALNSDSDVRVVSIASVVHSTFVPSQISFSDLTSLSQSQAPSESQADSWMSMMKRYGLTKLANILFASELQRRLDSEGAQKIISISLDPGAVSSPSGLSIWPNLIRPLLRIFFFTPPSEAVKLSLFAAAAKPVRDNIADYKGQYLSKDLRVIEPSSHGKDEKLARDLWDVSELAIQQMLHQNT